MRHIAFALSVLAAVVVFAAPWDNDSVRSLLEDRSLDPIEGIWQFPADGARLLIRRSGSSTFDIIVLDSPRMDVEAGCIIGNAIAAPKSGSYDATLDSGKLGNSRLKKAHAMLVLTSDGYLKFEPYSTGKRLNLRRWLPYMMRVIEDIDHRPSGLDGAKKVYPLDHQNFVPCL